MTKPSLILIGAGGHARSCIDVIERQGEYEILGLVGLLEEVGGRILGYEVIASDDDLAELTSSAEYALITLGQIETAEFRRHAYERAIQYAFKLPVAISPNAHVSRHAQIGAGSIVMHGAIVNAGAKVGRNCIVNSNALVEHDAIVGDHCHISTGAILNGGVVVEEGSFLGSGCVIREGLTIGSGSLVGIGLTLRHKLPNDSRFVGRAK